MFHENFISSKVPAKPATTCYLHKKVASLASLAGCSLNIKNQMLWVFQAFKLTLQESKS